MRSQNAHSRFAWWRVKFSMRLKFLGHRGHLKRWPEDEDDGVALGFVESFAGPLAEPLELLFPAARLLPLGGPSILGWGWEWVAQAGGQHCVENGHELLEWCGREVISHQRRDTRGWSLGSLRERWSCDVLPKWTAFAKPKPPATTLLVACRPLQESSRAMFPAAHSDNDRIGAGLMQRCRCESPETLHDISCMGENILEG